VLTENNIYCVFRHRRQIVGQIGCSFGNMNSLSNSFRIALGTFSMEFVQVNYVCPLWKSRP
jgi:hypothetical protein